MWKLMEITNGRKTCDNFDLELDNIPEILLKLEKNFDIKYCKNGGCASNFAGFNFYINGEYVTIGWDNWSGVFIMSHKISGNDVIKRIYEYLINN